jgi:hypothetical protein
MLRKSNKNNPRKLRLSKETVKDLGVPNRKDVKGGGTDPTDGCSRWCPRPK